MIHLYNINKSFGDKSVLNNLTYSIGTQGIHGITGPSGCGKTTLTRIVCGLDTADFGEIANERPDFTISIVFPEDRLIPSLSVLENVLFANSDKKEDALSMLCFLGLADCIHSLPFELSSGMKRRVAITRGFIHESDLLVLDEPFKGLDSQLIVQIMKMLETDSKKRPILLVSHDIPLLKKHASTILYLPEQRIERM